MPAVYRTLRRAILPIFKRFNPGDIAIRHHYTRDRMRLHSFRHKEYWFHGKRRDPAMMRLCRMLVQEGDTVLDIGGHIGYTALYFASLVGPNGRVFLFEPGPNNLTYLRHNIRSKPNVVVVEAAVCDRTGQQTLFVEDYSGQNNSLVPNYAPLAAHTSSANVVADVRQVTVATVTLDDFCQKESLSPQFVKVDAEGSELAVLQGGVRVIEQCRPILLVEILPESRDPIWQLVRRSRYVSLSESGSVLGGCEDWAALNLLLVPEEKAAEVSRVLRATSDG